MCMKYVNATVECYRVVAQNSEGQVSIFYDPFDTITAVRNGDGSFSIGGFALKTAICVLGTDNEKHTDENPICKKDKLFFKIRLTKCSTDEEKRLGIDLDEFEVNLGELQEEGLASIACYPFVNYGRITTIGRINLPANGFGKYVIKVLVRDERNHTTDSIQSMMLLTVLEPEKK